MTVTMSRCILAGDLGGTKTLLALAESGADGLHILREQRFASRDFACFDTLLTAFLNDGPPCRIDAACFGIAGPTDGRTAKLTYLPWHLDATALEHDFAIARVQLLNDFAAAARGIEGLQTEQLQTLQPGQPVPQAPRLVLGAGTGLGVAGLIWQDGRYVPVPGEGGHIGFAPQNARQMDLWRFLHARSGRVTAENVLCGEGLCRLYAFLGGTDKSPEEIGEAGIMGRDPRATQTLDLWLELYGAFAGDLALHWLARGGVYLAGGVAAKLMPNLRLKPFLDAFRAKREHQALATAMPVHLVLDERLGLLGALAAAQ